VVAWLAKEQWKLDIYNSDGKIYEAVAANMFSVPKEEITKESDLRAKGKVSELALGYQGALGALTKVAKSWNMALSDDEMKRMVRAWRASSPQTVLLWGSINEHAIRAVKNPGTRVTNYHFEGGLIFYSNKEVLMIKLPSGRKLFYYHPHMGEGRYGTSLKYWGVNGSNSGQWEVLDTYGGKLVENIAQAIARDILADSMLRLDAKGFDIRMHVHDEAVAETSVGAAENDMGIMCEVMGESVSWAPGLPLAAEGYISPFYKK
jgi:DNA polymerase